MTDVAIADHKPRLAVLTGAGISAPSGLPVYRGGNGMWDRNPDTAKFTTASRWHGKAQQSWDHWNELRRASYTAQPNPAHQALVAAEAHFDVHIATQNIDGLHTRAGSTNVTELHGSVFRTRCSGKACHARHGAWFDENLHETVPTCPRCGRVARLDVVLFGEQLPARKMRASIDAARHADVWIAVGTSGTVFPAAGLIDFCRPGTVRVLVNAQPWTDNASTFEREVLGDASTVLGDVLRELHAAALR
ncbi:NAD-dependent deacetylase [Streptomyces bingchenggensis BCW-1]|uniref:protein acetyllysine N-acetyltransferase n=1 Tax=Streptomyces bingchenggensis (strain BCW-1) TaxID=749414 RepID=D7CA37_STRBB|nr:MULTISPECIES: Sir2 family NAD-dependent protein deacetylase [Streptomyces]ADI04365.1 NAD-dependent deacetylase [Streptomyces bingchenggensis BCW-1]